LTLARRKKRLIRVGMHKVDQALDIITLVRHSKRLRALENHLFTAPQRTLLRMSRSNYLNESSATSPSDEYPNIDGLRGYEI